MRFKMIKGLTVMSLLKPTETVKRKQVRVNLSVEILKKIDQYCQWSDIKRSDEFIEKAAEFVFGKDKSWQQYLANQAATQEQKWGGRIVSDFWYKLADSYEWFSHGQNDYW